MNVLNATELYTLKWLILCYVNFLSIKKKIPSHCAKLNLGRIPDLVFLSTSLSLKCC